MSATSLPNFREDMFEFGEREIPRHGNRKPPSHMGTSWGLAGILSPNFAEHTALLATNITDRDTLLLLVDARFRQLEKEYGMEISGDEVRFLIPREEAQGLYPQGASEEPGTSLVIADGESTQQLFERAGVSAPSPVMERIVNEGISLVPAPLAAAA
ncbi:MAG TPA: hypothetical protein VFW77_00860 [Candidatus Saccharimonadales bacterium]|nr:hypothetical protein [Candidatus Saccharimonadales bacterium]